MSAKSNPDNLASPANKAESSHFSLNEKYPWAVFILPFVAYMLSGSLLPSPIQSRFDTLPAAEIVEEGVDSNNVAPDKDQLRWRWFGDMRVGDRVYPVMYAVRIALVVAIMLVFWRGYQRFFPIRISLWGIVVGAVGVVVWVGLCQLGLEERALMPIGLGRFLGLGERSAYNPLDAFQNDMPLLIGFLAVRFTGLAIIVPIIEEFFLRGFLMRFVTDEMHWEKVPFGHATRNAIIAGTVYGVLTHPAEILAAVAWFSMVTWLMLKTRNIWDCVMAHAVTNLLLGIYVLKTGHWELW